MKQLSAVHKQDKGRRLHPGLRRIINFEHLSLVCRRLLHHDRLSDDFIQNTCLNPHVLIGRDHIDQIIEPFQPLPCSGRNEQNLRIGKEGQGLPDFSGELLHRIIVLFDQIPFVDCDNDGLAAVMRDAGDFGILLGYSLLRIDHNHRDVGALHCCHGADDHIPLQFLMDLVLPAEPRGVNENILFAVMGDQRVDRIPGGSRNVRDDDTVFPDQPVDDG